MGFQNRSRSRPVMITWILIVHSVIGILHASRPWLSQGHRALGISKRSPEETGNIMKRDTSSQNECRNPTFSPSRLNSPEAACYRATHPNCSVTFAWTNRGCEASAVCQNLNLNQHTTGDSTVCWVKLRLFPTTLGGVFSVNIYGAAQNPNTELRRSYNNTAVAAASRLQTVIDEFRAVDTVILYVARSLFPRN